MCSHAHASNRRPFSLALLGRRQSLISQLPAGIGCNLTIIARNDSDCLQIGAEAGLLLRLSPSFLV